MARLLGKLSLIAIVAMFAMSAHAIPRTATFDSPGVLSWVDGSGTVITPFAVLAPGQPLYTDGTTGFVWMMTGMPSIAPTATGIPAAGFAALFYTTTNCTGTAYIATSDAANIVHEAGNTGDYYVGSALATPTIASQFFGSCALTGTPPAPYSMYTANGPLTPPTLAAGPWHLEVK